MKLTLDTNSWQLPILATFIGCRITHLSFQNRAHSLIYRIGSGVTTFQFPEVTQSPDCSQIFHDFEISDISTSLSLDKIADAVQLDSEFNELIIQTSDLSFAG